MSWVHGIRCDLCDTFCLDAVGVSVTAIRAVAVAESWTQTVFEGETIDLCAVCTENPAALRPPPRRRQLAATT